MGFAVTWIVFSLVCAVGVLALSGRVVSGSTADETRWNTWRADITRALMPIVLKIQIGMYKIAKSDQSKIEDASTKLDALKQARRQARDITKMAYMDDDYMSNTTIDEFFKATQTTESAYTDVDRLSGRLEDLYDSVADRRSSLKTPSGR